MTTVDRIKIEEGWRSTVYKDTRDVWTLGYGFNVDPDHGGEIPREVADFWIGFKVQKLETDLANAWPPFLSQPSDVQGALVEMSYQLGVSGLLKFKLMLGALERGDRETAAECARDSEWHKQTPARAERVAGLIRGD